MKWWYLLPIVLIACQNNQTDSTVNSTTEEQTIKKQDTSYKNNEPVRDEDQLIVPGERIGKVKLSENVSLLEVLGTPDKSDAAMGKAWLTWKGKRDEHNNATQLDVYTTYKDNTMREKTVQQIRTTSSQFITANNIHVYSSLELIRQEFPEIKKTAFYNKDGREIFIYDAVKKGIAFEIAQANDQQICTGIIVHERNKDVTQIYIMLHPDMKRL
jgi:hypothetical protein